MAPGHTRFRDYTTMRIQMSSVKIDAVNALGIKIEVVSFHSKRNHLNLYPQGVHRINFDRTHLDAHCRVIAESGVPRSHIARRLPRGRTRTLRCDDCGVLRLSQVCEGL